MLKVLIMDDEPYVREGLKYIIDWENYGFTICGEAADGEEGYEKILDLNPDIILIDIQMPGKLGLDIVREAKESGKNGKFIIISGYSNFEYAQKAIKYGVKEYLLKPIDEDELLEIVLKLKKEIEAEKNNIDEIKSKNIAAKQYVLEQMMLGKQIKEHEDVKLSFKNNKFQVALISNSLNHKSFDNILKIEEIISENIEDIENIDIIKFGDRIAVIIRNINESYSINMLNNIKEKIDRIIGGDTYIALGEVVNDLDNLYKSYRNAKKLTNNKFLFSNLGVVSNHHIEEIKIDATEDEKEVINRAYTYVEIGDTAKIEENIRKFESLIIGKMYSEEAVKLLITKSLLEFIDKIKKDYNIKDEDIGGRENTIDKIYEKDSLRAIIDILTEKLNDMTRKLSASNSNNSIKRVVRYIEKNYYKDLKLESLAEIFNYNSAYLGKIFKSYTGESFNTYLDKIRIEEAKKLLTEKNLKVYEVCENIGYKNIDYFHSKFKKYVGISPLNYKKQKEVLK